MSMLKVALDPATVVVAVDPGKVSNRVWVSNGDGLLEDPVSVPVSCAGAAHSAPELDPKQAGGAMSTSPSAPQADVKKHFTSSILLWVRNDQPRQTGMDYWKGPHSGIIAATPGLEEYRQIHLAESNPGLWPATAGVETAIPVDRNIDGVAEVTFQSALSPLLDQ